MTHPTCCYYKETVLRRIVVNDFLTLQNGVEMNCVPGVNVIIGENGTGKSTLMKLIYAVRTSFDTDEYWLGDSPYAPPTFPPEGIFEEEEDKWFCATVLNISRLDNISMRMTKVRVTSGS